MQNQQPLDLDAIYSRWVQAATDCDLQVERCRDDDNPHDNALHDLAMDDVPALLAEVDRLNGLLAADREYKVENAARAMSVLSESKPWGELAELTRNLYRADAVAALDAVAVEAAR